MSEWGALRAAGLRALMAAAEAGYMRAGLNGRWSAIWPGRGCSVKATGLALARFPPPPRSCRRFGRLSRPRSILRKDDHDPPPRPATRPQPRHQGADRLRPDRKEQTGSASGRERRGMTFKSRWAPYH